MRSAWMALLLLAMTAGCGSESAESGPAAAGTRPAGPQGEDGALPRVLAPADSQAVRTQRGSPLLVRPVVFDLGVLETREQRILVFEVSNSGEQPLRIDEVFSSCPCARVISDLPEVAPGAAAPLELRLDPSTGGLRDFKLTVRAAGVPRWEATASIRYATRPELMPKPKVIDFGRLMVGDRGEKILRVEAGLPPEMKAPELSIHVAEGLPVRARLVGAKARKARTSKPCCGPGSREWEAVVSLELDTSALRVPFEGEVVLRAPHLDDVSVNVRGEVHGDIYLEPGQVHFGMLRPGEVARRVVTLVYPEGPAPEIRAVETDPAGIEVDVQAQPDQHRVRLELTYTAREVGEIDGLLLVRVDRQDEPLAAVLKARVRS